MTDFANPTDIFPDVTDLIHLMRGLITDLTNIEKNADSIGGYDDLVISGPDHPNRRGLFYTPVGLGMFLHDFWSKIMKTYHLFNLFTLLLQVELLPRVTKRKTVIRRLSQQRHHYLTC